ncbi:host attachment protein [Microbulbifer marinus]|uniref:Protein required for attachment to host cells n=1 Tax=Microbulbifer marinus TaxID=658218 RepID=A0A1H4BAV9_9GAMM|nr:host attachment protein [Microbulbifer marinus]SEA45273.1 Protein required for attachment to host cells [Microbulbifer marinus]
MALAWVLVANQSQARLFEAEKRAGDLHELKTMVHPESRLPGREQFSDAPGRSFDSGAYGRHGMGNVREVHRRNGEDFAREIAHALERGRKEGRFEKLYIVAEPQMVGSLRDSLKSPTRATIAGEMGKNLVSCDPEEIRAQLPEWL